MKEKRMKALHEIIAVVNDVNSEFKRRVTEVVAVFKNKKALYLGYAKTLTLFNEARKQEEAAGSDNVIVTDSVTNEINFLMDAVESDLNVQFLKEEGNTRARADISFEDGRVVAANIPATYLLYLEKVFTIVRNAYTFIPTLPPGGEWIDDSSNHTVAPVYRRKHAVVSDKTEKSLKVIQLAPPTPQHKEQAVTQETNEIIGKFTKIDFCSMLSPARKSELIKWCDMLLHATKEARQRANCVATNPDSGKAVAQSIRHFLHTGECLELPAA